MENSVVGSLGKRIKEYYCGSHKNGHAGQIFMEQTLMLSRPLQEKIYKTYA